MIDRAERLRQGEEGEEHLRMEIWELEFEIGILGRPGAALVFNLISDYLSPFLDVFLNCGPGATFSTQNLDVIKRNHNYLFYIHIFKLVWI